MANTKMNRTELRNHFTRFLEIAEKHSLKFDTQEVNAIRQKLKDAVSKHIDEKSDTEIVEQYALIKK